MKTKNRPPEPADEPAQPEPPSFEDVYEKGVDFVAHILRLLGVPERSIPDAIQEVFLEVFRRLPTYEPQDNLRGWLSSIAGHIAARVRRSEGRHPLVKEEPEGGPEREEGPQDAEDFDLDAELASAEEVRRVLEALEPDLRLLFIQHHFFEIELAEIAKHEGLRLGTVKRKASEARRKARAAWLRYKARERRGRYPVVVPILGPLTWREAGRQVPRLPDEVRAQIWEGIQAKLAEGGAGGSGGGHGPGAGPPGAPAAGSAGLLQGTVAIPARAAAVVLGLILFGAGVLVGALWDPFHRALAPIVPSSPMAVPVLASAQATALAGAAPQASNSTPPSHPAATATAAKLSGVTLERALLNRASSALRDGAPDRAVVALSEHARSSTGRATSPRTGEARDRFARFEVAYPNSPRCQFAASWGHLAEIFAGSWGHPVAA
jgi:RNA polymerase sigma-70 factor, ECF subfamily